MARHPGPANCRYSPKRCCAGSACSTCPPTSGTSELLETYASDEYTTVVQHPANRGKGAALKTGFLLARGDVVVVQDADLEYDPADLRLLIQPIVEGRADVVYGSRFAAPDTSVPKFWHSTGNRMITLLSNIATNLKLTDVETCYKVFRREVIAQIAPKLQETGFGIELELTALISKIPGVRVHERPISYSARSYAEGKKIGLKDAFRAVWCIVKY